MEASRIFLLLLLINQLTTSSLASYLNFTTTSPVVLDSVTDDISLACNVPSADEVDAAFVVSLAISYSGTNASKSHTLAHVSAYVDEATVVDPTTSWTARGEVQHEEEKSSFLVIEMKNPTHDIAGEYSCEVDMLDRYGHTVTYDQSLIISEREVLPEDVAKKLIEKESHLASWNIFLQSKKALLEQRVQHLEAEKASLQYDLQSLVSSYHQTNRLVTDMVKKENQLSSDLSSLRELMETILVLPNPECTSMDNSGVFDLPVETFCTSSNVFNQYCQRTCSDYHQGHDIYGRCFDVLKAMACSDHVDPYFMEEFEEVLHCGDCSPVVFRFPNTSMITEIESNKLVCFPGSSRVFTASGEAKFMRDLQVGDFVLSMNRNGELVYSEVYVFLHQKKNQISPYYKLKTESGVSLTLSAEHLVYILDNKYTSPMPQYTQVKLAEDVNIGDILSVIKPSIALNISTFGSRVVSKTVEVHEGMYTPVTMEGTIVVDNVMASCYVINTDVERAEFLFSPLKMFYKFHKLVSSWSQSLRQVSFLPWVLEVENGSKRLDWDEGDGIHWYAKMLMALTPAIKSMRSVLGV